MRICIALKAHLLLLTKSKFLSVRSLLLKIEKMSEKENLTAPPPYEIISSSTSPVMPQSSPVSTQPTVPTAPTVPTPSTAPTLPTAPTPPTAPPAALKGYYTCPPQTQQPKGYPVQQIPLQGMQVIQNQPYQQAYPHYTQHQYQPTQPGQIAIYPTSQSTPLIIDASGVVDYLKDQIPSSEALQQMQQNQPNYPRQQHQPQQQRRRKRNQEDDCDDCCKCLNCCDTSCELASDCLYCLFCCWIFDCLCCLCK